MEERIKKPKCPLCRSSKVARVVREENGKVVERWWECDRCKASTRGDGSSAR